MVYLAHREIYRGLVDGQALYTRGIFEAFMPTGVDLVIADAANIPDKAHRLADKIGPTARIVVVKRHRDQGALFADDSST